MKYLSSLFAVSLLALSGCGGKDVETPKSGLLFQYNASNVKTGDEKTSPTASLFTSYQFLEAVLSTNALGEQVITTPTITKSFPLRSLQSKFRIEYFNGSALDDLNLGYTGVGYDISITDTDGYAWNSSEYFQAYLGFFNEDYKTYYGLDCETASETSVIIDGVTIECPVKLDFVNASEGIISGGRTTNQLFSTFFISPVWSSITTDQFIANQKQDFFLSTCTRRLSLLDSRLQTTGVTDEEKEAITEATTEALKWVSVDCGDRLRDLLAAEPVAGFRLPPNMATLNAEWLGRVDALVAALTANQNETIEQRYELNKLLVDAWNDQKRKEVYRHQLFNLGTYSVVASFNYEDPLEPALSNVDFQIILEDTSINATLEVFTTRCSQQLSDLKTQLASEGDSGAVATAITAAIKDVRIDCNEQIPLHLDYGSVPAGLLTVNTAWEASLETLLTEFEVSNAETTEQINRLDAFIADLAADEATLECLIDTNKCPES